MSTFYTSVQKFGNEILYRGVKDGRRVQVKYLYSPKLFIPCNKESEWKSIHGRNLELRRFETMKKAKEFISKYEGVHNFKIYGNTQYQYAFITDEFQDSFDWDIKDVDIAVIDIEVASKNGFPDPDLAQEEITAITVTRIGGTPVVFGLGDYAIKGSEKYIKCSNDIDLCERFIEYWESDYPDIISGWNLKFFDIPYLVNRFRCLFGEDFVKRLSVWGNVYKKTTFQRLTGKKIITYDLLGISQLDYLDMYKTFAKKGKSQENYRLNTIATSELGDGKVSYDEYDNLQHLYEQDHQKFIEYNIKDVEIILRLEDKLKLFELILTLAYETRSNYEDVFTQTRMWDSKIYNYLIKKKIVVDPKFIQEKDEAFEGAYVKDPQLGLHNWVGSFDLNSLYPHLMMQFNISPDTLIEPKDYTYEMKMISSQVNLESLLNMEVNLSPLKGCTVTPNKQFYRTDKKGFLPEILEGMYNDRKNFKKLQIDAEKELQVCEKSQTEVIKKRIARYYNLQIAMKVCLNSAYGAMGTPYFRYYDIRNALAVTQAGKLAIKWIEVDINKYLGSIMKDNKDRVIASDTDSIYVGFEDIVKYFKVDTSDPNKVITFMDRVCEDKLQPYIDSSYQRMADYTHAYAQKMKMKREVLANKGIWTAKKRYILNVFNSEGVQYKEPELKTMGLDLVRSSTPTIVRSKMKELIKIIVNNNEGDVQNFVVHFKEEFKNLEPEDIAFPRGVNGLKEYYDPENIYRKGTPIHVKGALIYNEHIKKLGLDSKYPSIKEGEKLKFIYLKLPNALMSPVISFSNRIPKEFGVGDMIDYDTQFSKTFVEPMRTVLECIGWEIEKKSTLESFFC